MSDRLTIIQGDCLTELPKLPAECVHCAVTSPPYWSLRDYKVPPTIWPDGWVGVFGLEPTPELYIEHSVLIFREVWRVLRKDGTLWLNLGDSYFGDSPTRTKSSEAFSQTWDKSQTASRGGLRRSAARIGSLKPGDLCGIPWRVALALQADGWFLRRDNIWFKPNPMPESVNGWRWERHRIKSGRQSANWKVRPKGWQAGKASHDVIAAGNYRNGEDQSISEFVDCPGCDKCSPNGGLVLRKGNWRCTTAHEYVFQFSKSDSYFCDAEAARERTTGNAHARGNGVNPKARIKLPGRNSREFQDRDPAHLEARKSKQNASFSGAVAGLVGNRNRRSVWQIPTAPYKDAHFATFPPNLVRPIIAAATSPKCCAACCASYAPVIERGGPLREQQLACGSNDNGEYHGQAIKDFEGTGAENASDVKSRILAGMVEKRVVDYRATCTCESSITVPAVVLDPFGGSGTVGQVADELGRAAILIELSTNYIPLIKKRCAITSGLAL